MDDDEDIRESLVSLLGAEGYQPLAVPGGRDALKLLGNGGDKPDVILLDLLMPSMDGIQFEAEVRRHAEWAKIPIIVCSAGPVPPDLAGRAFAVLQKPFDFDRLIELIDAACRTP
ncbi:MAG: response regulator [Myxococcales bacterium]